MATCHCATLVNSDRFYRGVDGSITSGFEVRNIAKILFLVCTVPATVVAQTDSQTEAVPEVVAMSIQNLTDPGLQSQKGALVQPVDGAPSFLFGERKLARTIATVRHTGWTFNVEPGTPVRAVASGIVVFANRIPGLGLTVIIDHGKSTHSVVAHLRKVRVVPGDRTKAGRVLGTSGASGSDEGPKVYFELRIDGDAVDPTGWFATKAPPI